MKGKATYLKVKDHSVSGESFNLLYNEELEMLETSPQPSKDKLSSYYQSQDYISHTDSKRNLFEKLYQAVKNITLKRKLKLINSFKTESKFLLDIGCGTGDFLHTAQKKGWSVVGIEPNVKARTIANQKTGNFVYDTAELLNMNSSSFDVITLWHVLEHLPDLENQLVLFKKLLKPDGRLIVAVPNFKSYDAEYYKEFWAAYDAPRHLWHFSKNSISKLMFNNYMVVDKIRPMKFDAYYVCLLSEKYKTGKMNPVRAFLTAFTSNFKARKSGEYSSLIYCIKNK